jgi:ribonuclease BN (tRNA processing enzyme)
MQFCFVGGGSGGGLNTSFHVTGREINFLIDSGTSAPPALKRLEIDRSAIDLILIAYFHGDHFTGLPFFLLDAQVSRRARPLTIAGPRDIETRLAQVMEALFERSSRTRPRFDLTVVELTPGQIQSFGAVTVTPYPVVHGGSGGPLLAYRIEAAGRTLAYNADTEWTEALIPLAHGADLFITEACMYEKVVKNHLSLKTLEQYLPAIGARQLVLTHMSDDVLSRLDDVPHLAAEDGMVLTV